MHLTAYEVDELKRVSDEHKKTCGAGVFVYPASGSGIGTRVLVSCGVCKREEDITDYGSW